MYLSYQKLLENSEIFDRCRQISALDIPPSEKLLKLVSCRLKYYTTPTCVERLPARSKRTKHKYYPYGMLKIGEYRLSVSEKIIKTLSEWLGITSYTLDDFLKLPLPYTVLCPFRGYVNSMPLDESSNYFELLCEHLGVTHNKGLLKSWLLKLYYGHHPDDSGKSNLNIATTCSKAEVDKLMQWAVPNDPDIGEPDTVVELPGRSGYYWTICPLNRYKNSVPIKNCEPPSFPSSKVIRELMSSKVYVSVTYLPK